MASATHDESPVFVVGFYRSGTSLLHALLNQHPRISLMYECDVLKLWPLVRTNSVKQHWLDRLEYWNHSLSRHRIDAGRLPGAIDRRSAAMSLYRSFAGMKQAAVVGEKSPYYHNCLPQLAADFPRSRIIVLWRSPREILQSIRKAATGERFFGGADWPQRLRVGLKAMAAGCAHLRDIGHPLLEIDYPSLINQQEQTLAQICTHIGVEFDSRMMSLNGADVSMLPAGEHHRNVRGDRILTRESPGEICPARLSPIDRRIVGAFEPLQRAIPLPGGDLHFTTKDRLAAARFAARDALVRMLYAHCPMGLLQNWRAWRCRRFQEYNEPVNSTHASRVPMPIG